MIGAELQIRVIPAAPARFSVTAPDAVAEGEPFTVSIDLKSGEISPEGIPIDFRLLNTQRFSIDPSSPTKVTSSERTLIRAIATPNLIAFDNADCNFVMEINGDRLAVPVAIVDKTPQLVSVTPSNEEVKVTEGSAIQWDISLPESVHASKQLTFHATITSEDGAEIRALTTNPPFEIVNGIAEISIPLAANESSTSLTIKAENNDQTDESNKQYVVRFQTNQQLWTAAEGFPSRVLLTVTDDDSYSLIPLEKLAVVESEASATLAVLRIDPPRPVDIELRFKAIGDSAGQEDFTIDLPQDASGFYRIKAAANSDAISIPVKANLDSKTEDPERFDLVFDSAKIPEPVSVQIRDPDVTGDVLVLVIATPAISSTLQETVADVASEFKETDGVLVDNSIYIVDNSESSYVRVPLDHPLPDLTFFETDASPVSMDKAISAWKSLNDQFSGRNRQLRRTIIVWKSSFSGDSSDGYAGWKNRPDNRFHLIWIGGQSGEDIQTSNLVESLTTLQNSGEAKLPLIPYRSDYLRIGDATQKLLRIELP